MIRAIRFKNESRLGDPRSPAEKLEIFINKTSCEVLNVVVTSTVIFENSSVVSTFARLTRKEAGLMKCF